MIGLRLSAVTKATGAHPQAVAGGKMTGVGMCFWPSNLDGLVEEKVACLCLCNKGDLWPLITRGFGIFCE